ncbi:MAG: cell wall-binding repeat-containing protein [Clostridiales bacterium]|nr:cell wall-binding repeat-containing protein [Clostridiales bacterium]
MRSISRCTGSPVARFMLVVALVVPLAVSTFPGPQEAYGTTAPQFAPTTIWETGFEGTYPPAGMTIGANPAPSQSPVAAWWGRITLSKRSGSNGLWCAGNNLANWSAYPSKTSGRAALSLPQLADFYSSQLSMWYTMPSRGAADWPSFLVGWHGTADPGNWHTYANFSIAAGWVNRAFDLSKPSNDPSLSRQAGHIIFEFDDRVEGTGQSPATGRGPTIDDISVTGYRFGPVRSVQAVSNVPGRVDLSWVKPAASTATTSDDTRTIVYRVWRRPLGGSTWTQIPGSHTSALSLSDTTAVAGTTYTYLVQPWGTGADANFWGAHQALNVTAAGAGKVSVVALAGENRYDTAIAIARAAYPAGAGAVVIATGQNWPDALGASALARAVGGPLLLTRTAELPQAVLDYLTGEIRPSRVFVVGGEGAVSARVVEQLASALPTATRVRVAGIDRIKTAEAVAARAVAERVGGPTDVTAFVATAHNYPDALAASPLAAAHAWPLYLTPGTSIADETIVAMKAAGVTRVVITGGIGAVSPEVEAKLRLEFPSVLRRHGVNRYETAVSVAQWGVAEVGLSWERVAIATGVSFPDALAGGVLQGRDRGVLLLTDPLVLSDPTKDVLGANRMTTTAVRFLGGTGAISQSVREEVMRVLNEPL